MFVKSLGRLAKASGWPNETLFIPREGESESFSQEPASVRSEVGSPAIFEPSMRSAAGLGPFADIFVAAWVNWALSLTSEIQAIVYLVRLTFEERFGIGRKPLTRCLRSVLICSIELSLRQVLSARDIIWQVNCDATNHSSSSETSSKIALLRITFRLNTQ